MAKIDIKNFAKFSSIIFIVFASFIHANWPGTPLSNWQYRRSITNLKATSGVLTNFPVLISIANDSSLASNALATGLDIVFTTNGSYVPLHREIEVYSNTGKLLVWVRIPFLTSDPTKNKLWMYYGNSRTNVNNSKNTWDSSTFDAVYHLNTLNDSTVNSKNLTEVGSTTVVKPGKIGNGYLFLKNTDHLKSAQVFNLIGNHTISFWVRCDYDINMVASISMLMRIGEGTTSFMRIFRSKNSVSTVASNFYKSVYAGNYGYDDKNLSSFVSNNYYYYTVAIKTNGADTTSQTFINGQLVSSNKDTSKKFISTPAILFLGNNYNGDSPFWGTLDEFQHSTVVRNPNWILTSYSNQVSAYDGGFYKLGKVDPTYSASLTVNQTNGFATYTPFKFSGVTLPWKDSTITNWKWDFGDGFITNGASLSNIVYKYTTSGTFTVCVQASAPSYTSRKTNKDYIKVLPPNILSPSVDIVATPIVYNSIVDGYAPLKVSFSTINYGGSITNWSWSLGDGYTTNGSYLPSLSYTFLNPGNFTVSLQVFGLTNNSIVTKNNFIIVQPFPFGNLNFNHKNNTQTIIGTTNSSRQVEVALYIPAGTFNEDLLFTIKKKTVAQGLLFDISAKNNESKNIYFGLKNINYTFFLLDNNGDGYFDGLEEISTNQEDSLGIFINGYNSIIPISDYYNKETHSYQIELNEISPLILGYLKNPNASGYFQNIHEKKNNFLILSESNPEKNFVISVGNFGGKKISINFYNIHGIKIKEITQSDSDCYINNNITVFTWDGYSKDGTLVDAGIYLYRINSDDIDVSDFVLVVK